MFNVRFAGDFGGYFGLFLGGSAISLFEIMDFIIYNVCVKLTSKRRAARYEHQDFTGSANVGGRQSYSSIYNLGAEDPCSKIYFF